MRPDQATHAYRQDLADVALAGQVIASHYAEPLLRHLVVDSPLRSDPSSEAAVITTLAAGEEFHMLDCTRGWAWGYAASGQVGYVEGEAVSS